MEPDIKKLVDAIRQTGFAIHKYHGPCQWEKIYENALVHRLRKQGIESVQQYPIAVYDEDGTVLGEFAADLMVEKKLLIEAKACKAIVDEHVAQLFGYLRSTNTRHGVLVNFGAPKFQIRKFIYDK